MVPPDKDHARLPGDKMHTTRTRLTSKVAAQLRAQAATLLATADALEADEDIAPEADPERPLEAFFETYGKRPVLDAARSGELPTRVVDRKGRRVARASALAAWAAARVSQRRERAATPAASGPNVDDAIADALGVRRAS